VHSEVGDHCVGARVNGRLVPLRTVLNNGDQVRILTSKGQTPSPDWEQVVVSGRARSRIRRFAHREKQAQHMRLGQDLLVKMLAQNGQDFSEKDVDKVLTVFECEDRDALYTKLGEGHLTARAVTDQLTTKSGGGPLGALRRRRTAAAAGKSGHAVPIRGLTPGVAVHLAKCCYPLPGDRIVGIMTMGKGVTVHTIDCDTLASFADQPENWVDLAWDNTEGAARQVSRLLAVLTNAPGSLGELATLIARHKGNISNLKFTNRTVDFFDMTIDVEVDDTKHLSTIIAALRSSPAIVSVKKARN
jgi:GTP pyrophosphokinase